MTSALLIPSYEPRPRVVNFLSQFKQGDFTYFLVVDDGSGSNYDEIFESIKTNTVFSVIRYPFNKGKGNALKTGLKHLLQEHPDLDFIVTADSDGQHLKKDILSVRDACSSHPESLTLGSRDFSKAPKKSQNGNLWSSRYFRTVSGAYIRDTQTGLRGIPSSLFPLFLKTHGKRFEFEMNFLLDAASIVSLEQVEIETVYEEGNEGSHFRPLADSLRIASGLIAYALGATLFIVLIPLLFGLMRGLVFSSNENALLQILYSNLISIFGTGLLVYILLQWFAFFNKVHFLKSLCKTLLILIPMCALQFACTFALPDQLGWSIFIVCLLSPLFAGVKVILDYRFVFRLKKKKKAKS